MKIVILSASPKNEDSVTLQVARLMEKFSSYSVKDEFTEFLIGNGEYKKEIGEKVVEADLVMFCSSLFHFSVPTQMMKFFDAIQEDLGEKLHGKPVTFFTTSSQLMDISAHSYVKKRLLKMGVRYIRSLSLLDVDILSKEGREEVGNWYHYVRDVTQNERVKFKDNEAKVSILDATDGQDAAMNKKIEDTVNKFKELGAKEVNVFHLRDYSIKPCQACGACYTYNQCILKDDFTNLSKDVYKDTDIIMSFGPVQDGLMGEYHKQWLDRHVVYGRFPIDTEIIFSYMADLRQTLPDDLLQFKVHSMSLDNFNRDYYAGVCDVFDDDASDKYMQDLVRIYNFELYPQRNYLSRGVTFIFERVACTIQGLAPRDYEYFKEHGAYDRIDVLPTRPVHNYKEAIQGNKNRLTPYKIMFAGIKEDESLKTKRRQPTKWNRRHEEVALDIFNPKIGFFHRLVEKVKGK